MTFELQVQDEIQDEKFGDVIRKTIESDNPSGSPMICPIGIEMCGFIPLYLVKSVRSVTKSDYYAFEIDVVSRIFRFR